MWGARTVRTGLGMAALAVGLLTAGCLVPSTPAPIAPAKLSTNPSTAVFPTTPPPYSPMPIVPVTITNTGGHAADAIVVNGVGVYSVPQNTCITATLNPGRAASPTSSSVRVHPTPTTTSSWSPARTPSPGHRCKSPPSWMGSRPQATSYGPAVHTAGVEHRGRVLTPTRSRRDQSRSTGVARPQPRSSEPPASPASCDKTSCHELLKAIPSRSRTPTARTTAAAWWAPRTTRTTPAAATTPSPTW